MRNIRKLYLQNAAGERFGLNGEQGVYASGLAGLGFSLSPFFADLSRGFFLVTSENNEPQNSFSCTIWFTRSPYRSYQSFVDWLASAGAVTLVYNPTGAQEYYRNISVNSVQKGELNAVGWLETPCSIFCNTPWYMPSPTPFELESSGTDESKRYDYAYSETLRYGLDSSAALKGTIAGAGHIPGSLELTYCGAITNPRIRLTGNISGRVYGICSVVADVLKFSTKYENSYVTRISASGEETDLLDALELGSNPFFHIPVNEPCTISIEADAAFAGVASMLVYYYFRSV